MTKNLYGCTLTSLLQLTASLSPAQKKEIGSELVPPRTPHSPGILAGETLYISGLQGTDPQTHTLQKDFAHEATNSLENIGRVLKDAGMSYSDAVSVQIFVADMPSSRQ